MPHCFLCGKKETARRPLNYKKECSDCARECSGPSPQPLTVVLPTQPAPGNTTEPPALKASSEFWTEMEALLDSKLKELELSFHEKILADVADKVRPLVARLIKVEAAQHALDENLKSEMTSLWETVQTQAETLTQQQRYLEIVDISSRAKNIIVFGLTAR